MREPIKGRITREALQEWLNGSTAALQAIKSGKSEICYTFFKVPQQDGVDFIFGQENYRSSSVGWHDKFEFCGAYSRKSRLICLADNPLTSIVDGLTPEEFMDSDDLRQQVEAQVNACVEEIIGNDRTRLPVQAITSGTIQESVQRYCRYSVKEEAVQSFVTGSGPDLQFRSWYSIDHWTEAGIANYLIDPNGYIRKQAENYIAENAENLLAQFLEHDALAEAVRKIDADVDDPLHRMRDITKALDQCGAKTVNVTVLIADTELSFKVPSGSLKGYRVSYGTSDIPAADRRLFYEVFGRGATYGAADITKITSGRKTIYEAPPVQTEDMVEGIRMGGISL